jgi:uncharacterized protein
MEKPHYKPRIIDTLVDQYLQTFGAVCIEGPKWCGKTWTSSFHAKSEFLLGSPEGNFQNKRLAELSPDTVLTGETPRLLDEWQEVPPLWDAVRFTVDSRNKKGQFILTGSATPNHKGILHSGAGRIARIRMRPMSLFESGDSSGAVSLKEICNGNSSASLTGEVTLNQLAQYICRGGWPGNISVPPEQAGLLAREYLKAIVADDVYRIDGIKRDTAKINLLLRSLARNECTTATNKTLRNDIKSKDDEDIDPDSVASYLDVLNRLFLLDNQLPFAPGARSSIRVKQAEKRHVSDPSLAAALLNMTPEGLIHDLNTFGFLFESLVERDLKIYAESFNARLFHYQDYNNREIDAVIELPGGEWCAFEIKLGANQIDEAAENLKKISTSISNSGGIPPKVLCVVCGLSNSVHTRKDGVIIVPLTALRN